MTVALLVALGAALVAVFLVVDRRMTASVLPPTAFRPGPLKWMYLTLGLLMAATMVDMYVPLFGQRLAHLVPVAAGFLGVALAVGWTVSEIVSASADEATGDRADGRRRAAGDGDRPGPGRAEPGRGRPARRRSRSGWWRWSSPVSASGMAWPHLSAWAMGCVDDPAEGGTAAAAINTVQLICGAFGAGLAGVVVNMTDRGDATAARWLFAVFAVLAAVGLPRVLPRQPWPGGRMTPPVIVSSPPECAFYRSAGDAIAAGSAVGARTFDAARAGLSPDPRRLADRRSRRRCAASMVGPAVDPPRWPDRVASSTPDSSWAPLEWVAWAIDGKLGRAASCRRSHAAAGQREQTSPSVAAASCQSRSR